MDAVARLYFSDELLRDSQLLEASYAAAASVAAIRHAIVCTPSLATLLVETKPRTAKVQYSVLRGVLPADFEHNLRFAPEATLAMVSFAIHHVHTQRSHAAQATCPHVHHKIQSVIEGFGPVSNVRDLKAGAIGQLVTLRATVIRVSSCRPLIRRLDFDCLRCLQATAVQTENGKYRTPSRCSTAGCNARLFAPKLASRDTVYANFQIIRVQESFNEDSVRNPRTLDCYLFDSFVDAVLPGDAVLITGVLRVDATDDGCIKTDSSCSFYLQTHCVKAISRSMDTDLARDRVDQIVRGVAARQDCFDALVAAFCKKINGHRNVKAGILLSMLGGSAATAATSDDHITRSNIHCLLLGDPGLGKSEMLAAASFVSNRAVLVSASTSSTGGLTAIVHQEAGSGEYAIEAGALVLADQGVCLIDELDKSPDQQVLLDAMEQQYVSVAKAGIICSLSARCSIIAAANPSGGHFDPSKTIAQNTRLPEELTSRFDLIFVLSDLSDRDGAIAANVFANKRHKHAEEEMPPSDLKAYLMFAKHNCQPRLSPDAERALFDYYVQVRTAGLVTFSTRQLQSLVRLSQARAKAELSPTVTQGHVQEVIEIMNGSGRMSAPKAAVNATRKPGKAALVASFVETIRSMGESISVRDLQELYGRLDIRFHSFEAFLDTLSSSGHLLRNPDKTYRVAK